MMRLADDWRGEPDEAEAAVFRRTWQPVDLAEVLDGTWEPPQPTVGRRDDGTGLFYPGKCHTIVSETEGGKTWLALSAARDEMDAGNHVVYLDFEDNEGAVVGRLLTLGAHRDTLRVRFHYLRPTDPLGTGVNLDDLHQLLTEYAPTLAVLDGITEAMTLHGLSPLDNTEAARFGKMLPRRIATYGPAVVSLDHVTKSAEGRGRYALGAAHKLNALDGAAYVLENRTPFGVGLVGRSTVKVAKDRPAQLRKHALPSSGGLHWFGDLVLKSFDETFAELTIYPPEEHETEFLPTTLMEHICDALTRHGSLSQAKIEAVVKGKATNIRQARLLLEMHGYVSDKSPHQLLKPWDGGPS